MSHTKPASIKIAKALPGRPRDEKIADVILREAVREISLNGLRNFSILSIARRAKVAKATVYLRWPDRNQLILDALRSTGYALHKPETGSLKGDLQAVIRQWADIFGDAELARVFTRLDSEYDEFRDIVDTYRKEIALPVNRVLEEVIRDAQKRGQARRDASAMVAARCIVGALVVQSRFNDTRVSEGFERQLADLIYAALAA